MDRVNSGGLEKMRPIAGHHSRRAVLSAAMLAASSAQLLTSQGSARQATPTPDGDDSLSSAVLGTALAKLDRLAAEQVSSGAVPGMAIAVVYRDQVIYSKGFGVRDVKTGELVTPDTVFQIASLSKPLSSSVVAAVVGDGVVGWDDAVSELYAGFELADPWITRELSIRDCFCHRSGVPGVVGAELEAVGYKRPEIIERMRYAPISGKFRETYSYSNMMLTLGALAAVAPLGESWEDVATERVFAPLGMTATSYRHQDFLDQENRSELHVMVDGAWDSAIKRDPEAQSPAGGVSTSVRDLAEWMRLELGGGLYEGEQVVDASALAQTHVPQIMKGPNPINGRPSFYALGWNSDTNEDGRIVWRHAGAFSQGARSDVALYPEEQLGFVALVSAFPTGVPDAMTDSFYDFVFHGELTRDWVGLYDAGYRMIFDAFGGDLTRFATPPAEAAPPLPLGAYVGTYANDYSGEVRVEEADGSLQVVIGPLELVWPLTHWDRDLFTYVGMPEPPAPRVAAQFTIDEHLQASQLLLENMNDIGMGTFLRVPDDAA